MGYPFDHIAVYSAPVHDTAIVQLQRRRVWNYLERIIPQLSNLDILELTNGNEEDAALLSDRDFNLVATDLSEQTLRGIQPRTQQYSMPFSITSHYLDPDGLDDYLLTKRFDLIYADVGALNRISPDALRRLFQKVKGMLLPGGRFVAVFISPFCLSQTIADVFTLRFKKAFARRRRSAGEEGPGSEVRYFRVSDVSRWSKVHFEKVSFHPIGIFSPGQGSCPFFMKRPRLVNYLERVDRKFVSFSFFSRFSDLFLVEIQKSK